MPRVGTVTAQPNANDSFPDGAWGRVAADGTVFVRTTDGERAVGPVSRGVARRGARLLHPALRRAGVRGGPPRTARPRRGALARRGAPVGEEGPRPGHRRQRGRRPRRADGPARRARAGARAAARGTPGRAREEARGVAGTQGADRGRGREARPGPRLAPRRQPAPRPARRVEGAPPAGPGDRRRAVAPLLVRAHVVHEGAQGALRRAGREARRRQAGQAAADQGGGGARDVHGVGPDRRQVPRADAAVEGGRPRRRRPRTTSCGGASVAPRTSSSVPARQPTPSRTRSSPPTR